MTIFNYTGTCQYVLTWSSTITGFLLGSLFSVYLYGTLTVQLYRYYISFPKDPKPFKTVIYIIYVTETICTALLIYDFSTIVTRTRGFGVRCSYDPQLTILAVCGGIVAFLTQSMYAYRIRIITKLRYMSWVIILVMALQLSAIVTTSCLVETTSFFVVLIWASVSLIVDVTITSTMVWFLNKDEIYSKQLKRKITRIIYLIIGTGFLTAATNLCILVSLFWFSAYTVGILIALSKLYANSMMVLVNTRIPSARSEINRRTTLDMITVRLSSFHATPQAAVGTEHGQREISVDSEAPSVRLSVAHEAENTPTGTNHELGSLTA